MDRVRVFIGTETKTEIPRKVLEFSIKQHTEAEVECVPMIGPAWEYPAGRVRFGTGFSLRRWMIPAYCGWQGRAIYLDADMLVFGDVREIWAAPEQQPGPACWATYQPDAFSRDPWPQTSVLVIDCAKAKAEATFHLNRVLQNLEDNPTAKAYQQVMHGMLLDKLPGRLPVEWNHLGRYHPGKTKLLHYTSVPNQPWYSPRDELGLPWKLALQRALNAGVVTDDEVRAACAAWGRDGRGEPTGLHPDYRGYVRGGGQGKNKQKVPA